MKELVSVGAGIDEGAGIDIAGGDDAAKRCLNFPERVQLLQAAGIGFGRQYARLSRLQIAVGVVEILLRDRVSRHQITVPFGSGLCEAGVGFRRRKIGAGLFDMVDYARDFEMALTTMFKRHEGGYDAEDFEVT